MLSTSFPQLARLDGLPSDTYHSARYCNRTILMSLMTSFANFYLFHSTSISDNYLQLVKRLAITKRSSRRSARNAISFPARSIFIQLKPTEHPRPKNSASPWLLEPEHSGRARACLRSNFTQLPRAYLIKQFGERKNSLKFAYFPFVSTKMSPLSSSA